MKRGQRGVVLISFMLVMLILLIGVGALYGFAFSDYRASVRNEWLHQATYVAEAGIDQKLVQLMQGNKTNIVGVLNFDNAGAQRGNYQIFYGVVSLDANGNRVLVNPSDGSQTSLSGTGYAVGDEALVSTGTLNLNGVEQARKVLRVTVQQSAIINPRAAVTISGIASTNGAVIVDGREHDSDGNLTGAPGKFGISTSSSTFNQGGNSKVGGNGIAPAKPANPATYELNAPPLPNDPEQVLGLSVGSLDQFKTQTPPSTPFNGIVYLTSSWVGVNFNGSNGVLIVHNSAGTAFLKNIHGNFKGLIITDDIIHINGDSEIIGAVYGLKTGGVTLGNGSGEVKLSTSALSNIPLAKYTVTSWEDSQND